MPTWSQVYNVTLNNKKVVQLDPKRFADVFPNPGHNFETRLQQIRHFHPTAIDWDLVDVFLPPENITNTFALPKRRIQ
jgi:hypothetical protein